MKKFVTSIACMAVAIAGMGFASCSSDDLAETNPNYDPATKEVYANLVLNIATSQNNSRNSRQTTAITQATLDQTFRGIMDAKLFAHIMPNDGSHLAVDVAGDKVYDLGNAIASGNTFVDGTPTDLSNRIFEIALPTGTNTLSFYGRAIKDGTPRSGLTQDEEFGKIAFELSNVPNATHFDLTPRLSDADYANFQLEERLMAFVQNGIQLCGINGTNPSFTANSAHVNVSFTNQASGVVETSDARVTWQDYYKRKASGETLLPLEEVLADAYKQFVTIGATELRAGSGPATARTIGDLWTTLDRAANATPSSLAEAQAKAVAEQTVERIAKYFTEKGVNCKWKVISTILTNVQSEAPGTFSPDATTYFAALTTAGKDINNFPSDYRVPAGGCYMQFNGGSALDPSASSSTWEGYEFAYVTAFNASAMGNPDDITPQSYTYPAELCYFGNSPIRVTDMEYSASSTTPLYPNGVANWDDDTKWGSTWAKNSHVISTTRSVAMVNDINYGSALLKTTVRYSNGTLTDNREAFFPSEKANQFNVANGDAAKFVLTGIIVGGQCGKMGWDYTRFSSTEKFNKWLYDNAINTNAGTMKAYTSSGNPSDPNYTLVFDNYDSSLGGNDQSDVYVALEFRNDTGKDFWGRDNIITNGGTFYLIGKLSPSEASNNASLVLGDEYKDGNGNYFHCLPPYDANGATIQAKRVFIQDHTTTANFAIGANSLKYAYLTVPDLRSSQISLGVSVDMEWETGLTFDNVILGGN